MVDEAEGQRLPMIGRGGAEAEEPVSSGGFVGGLALLRTAGKV